MPKKWKTSPKTKRLVPSEHAIQCVLIEWVDLVQSSQPELGMLFAIPNGGLRSPSVAASLRKEGVRKGVPDLMLPVPRCGLHGLFLEMKAEGGTLSVDQKWWRSSLISRGFGHAVCYTFEEAKQVLLDYLADKWRVDGEISHSG